MCRDTKYPGLVESEMSETGKFEGDFGPTLILLVSLSVRSLDLIFVSSKV